MEQLNNDFEKKANISQEPFKSEISGIIYDYQMLLHSCGKKSHPEIPTRLKAIIERFQDNDIFKHKNLEVVDRVKPATRDQIRQVHSEEYVAKIDKLWPEKTRKKTNWYFDTYYNQFTTQCAYAAAGGAVQAVDYVMKGLWKNAFAYIRPPGHHAGELEDPVGFCFFNNAGVAARYAQQQFNIKKVLIFDWDVHHGDGTQYIFYNDPSVLYSSCHVYDEGKFFPIGGKGADKCAGGKNASGLNVNIPWNIIDTKKNTVGDYEYIFVFDHILYPIYESFNPDLVIVSAGFDSAINDPFGNLQIQDGYCYMMQRLMQLANGKVVTLLEGGYNLNSLSRAAELVQRTLFEEEMPVKNSYTNKIFEEFQHISRANKVALNCAKHVFSIQKQYWACLRDLEELFLYKCHLAEIMNHNLLGKLIHLISDKSSSQKNQFQVVTRVDVPENLIYNLIHQKKQDEKIQAISKFFPKIDKIIAFGKAEYYQLEKFMGNAIDNVDGIRLDLCIKHDQENHLDCTYYSLIRDTKTMEIIEKDSKRLLLKSQDDFEKNLTFLMDHLAMFLNMYGVSQDKLKKQISVCVNFLKDFLEIYEKFYLGQVLHIGILFLINSQSFEIVPKILQFEIQKIDENIKINKNDDKIYNFVSQIKW